MAKGLEILSGDQSFVQVWVQNPSGKLIDLTVMPNHLMSFVFRIEKGDVGILDIELFDPTLGDLEDVIFTSGALKSSSNGGRFNDGSHLVFQYGWVNGARSVKWKCRITEYTSRFDLGTGTTMTIKAIASPMSFGAIRRDKVWNEDTPPNTMIEFYARKNGFTDLRKYEIEEAFPISVKINQSGMSDLAFIKTKIAPLAISKKTKRGGYRFSIKNSDTIVFTTDATVRTEFTYIFGREKDSILMSFEAKLHPNIMLAMGGQGFKVQGFDRRNKIPITAFINSDTVNSLPGYGNRVPPPSSTPAPLRVAFDNKDAATAYAEAKFIALNATNVIANATLLGNPQIEVDDIINILVIKGMGNVDSIKDLHPASGRYNIKSLTHEISAGGNFITSAELYRRGSTKNDYGGGVKTKGTQVAVSLAAAAGKAVVKAKASSAGKTAFKKAREIRKKRSTTVGNS